MNPWVLDPLLFWGIMKDILDQMEEHIAAIRNLQRNFDFHSKKLEKLMIFLNNLNLNKNKVDNSETAQTGTEKND